MADAQINESEWHFVDLVITKESHWNPKAENKMHCIGMGQACPKGVKPRLLAECPNWQNDPICQMKLFNDYTIRRYGSWQQAWEHHIVNNWY